MNKEILNIVRKALIEESKSMCSECGSKSMVEGECSECGYMKEDMMEGSMCSECGGGPMVEGECSECGYSEGEVTEKLYGKQHIIDKNKNRRIDREDFKLLRKKKEMKERLYGNQHRIDKNKNNKIDAQDFKMLRKEGETTYEMVIDDSDFDTIIYEIYHEELGTNLVLSEEQVVNLIEIPLLCHCCFSQMK
jgi:hypothetical protein